MAAISATYNFTPAVQGGAVSVTGENETQIKNAVIATIQTRKAQQQGNVDNLQSAENAMNG